MATKLGVTFMAGSNLPASTSCASPLIAATNSSLQDRHGPQKRSVTSLLQRGQVKGD